VFVRPASFGGVSAPEALARAYRLTPTELRVLLAVVDGGGVSNVADTLGVAESTVKFHLRRLFEKTGARRQSELVRIAAGFSAPLLG
jgi:DNA-binding CsgD family transcriptional regulator